MAKKPLLILFLLIGFVFIAACSKDEDEPTNPLVWSIWSLDSTRIINFPALNDKSKPVYVQWNVMEIQVYEDPSKHSYDGKCKFGTDDGSYTVYGSGDYAEWEFDKNKNEIKIRLNDLLLKKYVDCFFTGTIKDKKLTIWNDKDPSEVMTLTLIKAHIGK